MVQQRDFTIVKTRRRLTAYFRNILLSMHCDAPSELNVLHFQRIRKAQQQIAKLKLRTLLISSKILNITSFSERDALHLFRFRVHDIGKIVELTNWTSGVTKRNRYRCDVITACCIVLRKLSTPVNWHVLETELDLHTSALSEVFWEVVESLVESQGQILTDFRHHLMRQREELYASAVHEAGAPLDRCVGFIDCTKIRMTRPGGRGSMQRACYSGHKRMYCLVYQTITTSDGLVFSFFGPEVGRRHDTTLLRRSGLEDSLQSCRYINSIQHYIYGDAAYMLRQWLQTGFDRNTATTEHALFNKAMSAVRVAVEWSYKDVKQQWYLNDYARGLKVRRAPVSLLYMSSVLFWNFKVSL